MPTGATKLLTAPAGSNAEDGEEAEEGELEPGERAAGWDSGPEEEVGRATAEPAGVEHDHADLVVCCRPACLSVVLHYPTLISNPFNPCCLNPCP